jgi:hypothetical protein
MVKEEGVEEVFAVGTPVSVPSLRGIGVEVVVVYGSGRGPRAVIRDLRRRRPRLAAIVYCDSRFAGHLKLEALALASGAKRVWRLAPGVPWGAIGRARLAWSVFVKSADACGRVLFATGICGVAFVCLRARSAAGGLAGGSRASRA